MAQSVVKAMTNAFRERGKREGEVEGREGGMERGEHN